MVRAERSVTLTTIRPAGLTFGGPVSFLIVLGGRSCAGRLLRGRLVDGGGRLVDGRCR